jgi:D-amino-acid oxidase
LDVTVVGAGVAGLSTAWCLLDAGHRVRVVATDPPPETTSAVAAAVWYPYLAEPPERVLAWGARTLEVFTALEARRAGGVRLAELVEVVPPGAPEPWFRGVVDGYRRLERDALPGGHSDGWRFTAPVVPTPRYLPWLAEDVRRRGGRVELRRLASLHDVSRHTDVVVCCAGLGARDLVGDRSVVPVRGQVAVATNPGLDRVLLDESTDPEAPTYVIPRGVECVLGGTAEAGRWSVEPEPATAAAIVERCTALEPRLASAPVLEHKAGLRPARPSVRLELGDIDGTPLVHNYGHGGAGITLSWGCAEEAARLVRRAR